MMTRSAAATITTEAIVTMIHTTSLYLAVRIVVDLNKPDDGESNGRTAWEHNGN